MNDDDFVQRLMTDASQLPPLAPKPQLVWAGVRRRRNVRVATGAGVGCVALAGGAFAALQLQLAPPSSDRDAPPAATSPSPSPSQWCFGEFECFDQPGPNGWTRALQVLVEPYVDQIRDVGTSSPDFASASPTWEPPGVTVYWHGSLPAELDPIIADAASAGVQITHFDIPYRVGDLTRAIATITQALGAEGIAVSASGLANDFTGIELAGPQISSDPDTQARVADLANELLGGITVTFIPDPGLAGLY